MEGNLFQGCKASGVKLVVAIVALSSFMKGFVYATDSDTILPFFQRSLNILPNGFATLTIENMSIIGSIIGAIVFGYLGSRIAMRKLYFFALIGTLIVSSGYFFVQNSVVYGLLEGLINFLTIGLFVLGFVYLRRYSNERMTHKISAPVAVIIVFIAYQIGDFLSVVTQQILIEINTNEWMVNSGWRLFCTVPAMTLVVVLAVLILFAKDFNLAPIDHTKHSFRPGLNVYRQAIIAIAIMYALMYLTGTGLIYDVVPSMYTSLAWTQHTATYIYLGMDILAIISLVGAYFLCKKYTAKKLLVIGSVILAVSVLSVYIAILILHGHVNNSTMPLTVLFLVVEELLSNLLTWMLPMVIVLRITPTHRLSSVIGVITAVGYIGSLLTMYVDWGATVLDCLIFSIILVIVTVVILPSEKLLVECANEREEVRDATHS